MAASVDHYHNISNAGIFFTEKSTQLFVGLQEVHEHEASENHGAGAAGRLIAARSQRVKGKTSGVPPPLTLCALPAEK